MDKRIGLTQEMAIEALWVMTRNLSRLLAWLVFWIAHLVLALLSICLLWWFQVTPTEVAQAIVGASQSATASVVGLVGMSAAGVLGAYLAFARWIWRKTYLPWHADRLLDGVQRD